MEIISNLIIPLIILGILTYALVKGVDVFDVFLKGAKEGIGVTFKILPALIGLITAVGMLTASGGLDIISKGLEPLAKLLFLPKELIPLALLRPISGSGALAIYENVLSVHGVDSFIGRVASVMQGSTETTFYTIAVYYGAAKILKTRYTLVSSLTADMVGFIMSAVLVSVFLN